MKSVSLQGNILSEKKVTDISKVGNICFAPFYRKLNIKGEMADTVKYRAALKYSELLAKVAFVEV
jgi:hypothetical protein